MSPKVDGGRSPNGSHVSVRREARLALPPGQSHSPSMVSGA